MDWRLTPEFKLIKLRRAGLEESNADTNLFDLSFISTRRQAHEMSSVRREKGMRFVFISQHGRARDSRPDFLDLKWLKVAGHRNFPWLTFASEYGYATPSYCRVPVR